MYGLAPSKQLRNMLMHDVPAPMFNSLDIQGKPQRLADYKGKSCIGKHLGDMVLAVPQRDAATRQTVSI
jgi:hypothetical protein